MISNLTFLICCEVIIIAAITAGTIWLAFKRPGLTLVLTFILSIAVIAIDIILVEEFSGHDEFDAVITIPIMFSVLWFPCVVFLLSFIPQPEMQDNWPWWKILARTIVWIVSGLFILGFLSFLLNILGVIFFILSVAGIFRYLSAARYNRALEFVSTLAAAMRQNLPLPTALQTTAIGRRDKTARIFRRTAHWLTQGYSLAEAVRKGYPRCLPEVVSTIESAEKLSQLPQTLLSLEKDLINNADETKKVRPVHPWYPVIVFIIVSNLMIGLLIFIIPTFAAVISDMSDGRTHLPAATQLLFNISNTMLRRPAILAVTLFGGSIAIIGWWSYYHFRTRIAYKPGPFLNLVYRIRWYWPLQRRLERNMATLRLVEILRHGLSAGWPLNQSIAAALSVRMNCCFQKRLRQWLGDVEQGIDAAQSARARGIGSSVAWALDGKINPGQAPTLLEMLEETYRSKQNYIGNLIRSVMWPVVVLLMGLFVGFVIYAMFSCLVQMINVCIENVTP